MCCTPCSLEGRVLAFGGKFVVRYIILDGNIGVVGVLN